MFRSHFKLKKSFYLRYISYKKLQFDISKAFDIMGKYSNQHLTD